MFGSWLRRFRHPVSRLAFREGLLAASFPVAEGRREVGREEKRRDREEEGGRERGKRMRETGRRGRGGETG